MRMSCPKYKKIWVLKIYILSGWLWVLTGFLQAVPVQADDLSGWRDNFLNSKMMGDFNEMVERRFIRILVPYSKTFYFIDRGTQRGASYEMGKAFEKAINEQLSTRHLKIHCIFIPTPRNRLIPALADGLGDIALGNLTITRERKKFVDFADPIGTGVNEILITGKQIPHVSDIQDLCGKGIHVRKASSYYQSLEKMNKTLSIYLMTYITPHSFTA